MNSITIEDIGIKKEIELAAEITADHYKRLIAVVFIFSNRVIFKVVVDGDVKVTVGDALEALDAFNSIYLKQM